MAYYYVNKNAQPNGEHEIHNGVCPWLPPVRNIFYLGEYNSCFEALEVATQHYNQVNGCVHCSELCHRG